MHSHAPHPHIPTCKPTHTHTLTYSFHAEVRTYTLLYMTHTYNAYVRIHTCKVPVIPSNDKLKNNKNRPNDEFSAPELSFLFNWNTIKHK